MKLILDIFFFILVSSSLYSFQIDSSKHYRSENLFRKGFYYFNEGQYILSSKFFLRALSYDNQNYRYRYWLAKAYYYSGYVTESRREWKYLMDYFKWEEPNLNYDYQSYFFDDFLSVFNFDLEHKKYVPVYPIFKQGKVFHQDGHSFTRIKNPSSVYWDEYYHQYWVVGYQSNNVVVLNRNGVKIDELSASGNEDFKNPYDVIMNDKGEFFVSDSGNHKIHKFYRNAEGEIRYEKSFGSFGYKALNFKYPKGLTLDDQDFIYVVDSGNHRIQKLDSQGNFLFAFGFEGSKAKILSSPTDIVVLKNYIYVTDTGNSRVQIYDLSGNWIKNLSAEHFLDPRGLKIINEDYILVTDLFKGGLWIINTGLLTLSPYKLKNAHLDTIAPSDLFIDDNNYLYILDFHNSDFKIYIPENYKYTNLNVYTLSTFYGQNNNKFTQYISMFFSKIFSFWKKLPTEILKKDIVHKVLVKDYFGQPLHGLDKYNFKIESRNKLIARKDFEVFEKKDIDNKGSNLIYIIQEKTFQMKKNKDYLNIFIGQLMRYIRNNKLNVEFKIMQYNSSYWVPSVPDFLSNNLEYYYQKLNLKSRLSMFSDDKDFPLKNDVQGLGEAFYESVNRLIRKQFFNRRAIFILTSSDVTVDAFKKKTFENCLFYAKNNQIPVYVFSFDEKSKVENKSAKSNELLQILSKKTRGLYFNFKDQFNMKKIFYHYFYDVPSVYYIKYPMYYFGKDTHIWNSLFLEVSLKETFGSARSGFYLDF